MTRSVLVSGVNKFGVVGVTLNFLAKVWVKSVKHYSYGPTVQSRVKRLFKVLLSYACKELEDTEQFHSNLKVNFQIEEKKLIVRTKLRTLENLIKKTEKTEKDEPFSKFTKEQIRDAINYLKNYLEILVDNREYSRGSEEWHFTLMLWSKDKAENLKRFDAAWQEKLPPKSKLLSPHREARDFFIEDCGLQLPEVPVPGGVRRQETLSDVEVTSNLEVRELDVEKDLELTTDYLKVDMRQDPQFAKEVQDLANEIDQALENEDRGKNVMNVHGGKAYQQNQNQGEIYNADSITIHKNP